ncbi:MAG: hypothetical protein JXD18_06815 [Anaerolineae bacterium]|nr:hypothetical protein [Anaerolineae bacterium]
MTHALWMASVVLAVGTLGGSLVATGAWLWGVLVLGLGALWLARRKWQRIASWSLFFFTIAAVNGLWRGVAPFWGIAGVTAALVAWDLDHFARRLEKAALQANPSELEQRHMRRLLAVSGTGLSLALLPLIVRVELHLGVALLLGALAVVGLSRVVAFIKPAR